MTRLIVLTKKLGALAHSVLRPFRPLLLLALLPSLAAAAEPTRTLQSVDFVALEGDRVQITLTLSEPAPEPVIFTVDKPARLSLDLPDTKLAVAERYKKINVGKTRAVGVAESKGRARVVVELAELVPYNVRVDGNKVYVEVQSTGAVVAPAPPRGAISAPVTVAPTAGARVLNVDFRRGEKGEGRVVVTLADPRTPVDVREEGGRVIASFKNAAVADNLVRRLDVLDFATPVKFVDTTRRGGSTEIVLTPIAARGDFEQVAYQTGNLFTLELQPISEEKLEERKRLEPQYTGERISLSFQNVDIRSLLQIIADVAGTNMVVSDSVRGEIAMRLQNVPWDQALDIILRTKGLDKRQQGNVMLVAPIEELANREKAVAEADKAKVQAAPLRSEIIQVNYAKAADIAALIKSGDNSILSERGRVSVDDRTNTLLVLETREKLSDIRTLVTRLDIPVRQVLIESRVVIANNDFSQSIGARFGVTGVTSNGNNGLITTSGTSTATDTTVQSFLGSGGTFPVDIGALGNRFNVNLPTPGAGSIALAVLGSDYLVDLELSAMQAEGRGEVVSSPRVITANAKQASIEQGVEIPYLQASSSGATNVSFKKAVLSLNVTPQITPDGRIIMDLQVNKDSVGQNVNSGLGGTIPSIDTRKVNTQVLVDNGQTVVLGGVYEQTQAYSVTKVPFLGDLPLLGVLFRTNSTVNNKRELLIFVTPKILSEGLRVN